MATQDPTGIPVEMLDSDELTQFVDARVHAATSIDVDKVNVNGKPVYWGPFMILSDQDVTALKHHVLSSGVMGTAFVGLIAWISDPSIPMIYRALLMGGILTGAQGALVALSNIGIALYEMWGRAGHPRPSGHACVHGCIHAAGWCLRLTGRACRALWNGWVAAHVIHLKDGSTLYYDGFTSFVVDDGESN